MNHSCSREVVQRAQSKQRQHSKRNRKTEMQKTQVKDERRVANVRRRRACESLWAVTLNPPVEEQLTMAEEVIEPIPNLSLSSKRWTLKQPKLSGLHEQARQELLRDIEADGTRVPSPKQLQAVNC